MPAPSNQLQKKIKKSLRGLKNLRSDVQQIVDMGLSSALQPVQRTTIEEVRDRIPTWRARLPDTVGPLLNAAREHLDAILSLRFVDTLPALKPIDFENPEPFPPLDLSHLHINPGLMRQVVAMLDGAIELLSEVLTTTSAAKKGPRRPRRRDESLENLRRRVREMRQNGLTHREMCIKLANSPRPPQVGWRDLEWPIAYARHSPTVRKWLSDASKDRS